MRKTWILPALLVLSLLLAGMALAAPSAQRIVRWVIGGGGASGTAGSRSLDGTVGQWAVGSGTSGTTQLGAGFWGGGRATGASDANTIYLPVLFRP